MNYCHACGNNPKYHLADCSDHPLLSKVRSAETMAATMKAAAEAMELRMQRAETALRLAGYEWVCNHGWKKKEMTVAR